MNTAVGLGLTAGLFVFGIVLVGTMIVLDEVLGGVDPGSAPKKDPGGGAEPGPAPA
jgi:hypothetical protein